MISICLSLSELIVRDACDEGVALFEAIAGDADEIYIEEWTPLHAVWIRVVYPSFARWLEQDDLIPSASLSGADLRGADLRNAELYRADLRGADLRNAYLRDAYLRDACLIGADLRGANLRRANLHYASLRNANMRGADLRDACLIGADFSGADLLGAIRYIAPFGWVSVDGYLRRAT